MEKEEKIYPGMCMLRITGPKPCIMPAGHYGSCYPVTDVDKELKELKKKGIKS